MKKKIAPDTASLNVIDQMRQEADALVQDFAPLSQIDDLAQKYIAHELFIQRTWTVIQKGLFNGPYWHMPKDSTARIKRDTAVAKEKKRHVWTNRAIYTVAPCAILGFVIAAPFLTAVAATAGIVAAGAALRGVNHWINEHRNDTIYAAWRSSHDEHLEALKPHMSRASDVYHKSCEFAAETTKVARNLQLFATTPDILSSLDTLPLLTQEFVRLGVAELKNPVIDIIQNDGKALTVRKRGIADEQKINARSKADISYYPALFATVENQANIQVDLNALRKYATQSNLKNLLERAPRLQQAFAQAGIQALTRPVAKVVTNDDLRIRIRMK